MIGEAFPEGEDAPDLAPEALSWISEKMHGREITAEGKTYGKILFQEQGEGGFGYDPLFESDDLKKSFGLATAEEKNAVSHRFRALQILLEKWQKVEGV